MVQLYLGVLTLVDIVSDDGRHIQPWALSGCSKAKPMIPWQNQGRLPDRCWVIWRRFLKTCFAPTTQKSHRLIQPIKLHQQLGEWKTKSPYTVQEYYYSSLHNAVYRLYQ
eukprot:9876432-Ditylum_brightwellii.AAC.1